MKREKEWGCLSGNQLKILAALFMVCDHVGMLFFPEFTPPMMYLRYIGRLVFPIFAFFIAEGCRYTKNKRKYLGTLAFLGLAFHVVYTSVMEDNSANVIVTFALGVALIFLWQIFIDAIKDKKAWRAVLGGILFVGYGVLCFFLTRKVHVDYYFGGVLLPWLVYLTKKKYLRLFLFALGIVIVCFFMGEYGEVQLWGLLAVPLMALYNGKRGEWKMKYFFYIFYPAHIVALYGISLLVMGR